MGEELNRWKADRNKFPLGFFKTQWVNLDGLHLTVDLGRFLEKILFALKMKSQKMKSENA